MGRLLLLFIVVPVLELFLLIELGQRIGTLTTLALIIVTGTVGASLARQQGLATLARLRADLAAGHTPAEPLMDGGLILVAAAVLITPGVLTDVVGFLFLIPACRQLIKRSLRDRFDRAVRQGTVGVRFNVDEMGNRSGRPPMKNVTPPGSPDRDS